VNEPVEVAVHEYLLFGVIQNEFHNDVREGKLQEVPPEGVVNYEGYIIVNEVSKLRPIHCLEEEVSPCD